MAIDWMRVTVADDGVVTVIDEVEGVVPEPFETVMGEDGEEMGRLILAIARVKGNLSGKEPLEEVAEGLAWLRRRGYVGPLAG